MREVERAAHQRHTEKREQQPRVHGLAGAWGGGPVRRYTWLLIVLAGIVAIVLSCINIFKDFINEVIPDTDPY